MAYLEITISAGALTRLTSEDGDYEGVEVVTDLTSSWLLNLTCTAAVARDLAAALLQAADNSACADEPVRVH